MAMPVYLLDSNFVPTDLIDPYVSVVWSERYSEPGDLVLKMLPDPYWINKLTENSYIGIPGSDRVMFIEGTEIIEQDGATYFNVTGRTLEALLEAREIGISGTFENAYPGYVAQYIAKWGFNFNATSRWDNLNEDRLVYGGYPTEYTVNYALKDGIIYHLIKEIIDANDYGLRMLPTGNSGQILLDIYNGVDRTDMIFSTAAGTLKDPQYTNSFKGSKNYAIVYYKPAGGTVDAVTVFARPGDSNRKGFSLRSVRVDAQDIDSSKLSWDTYLDMVRQRGVIELAKHKKVKLFTGSVVPNPDVQYGRTYGLGDIGYLRGATDAMNQQVRVTEYIFSSDDENGDQQYPTFAVVQ
jgi:hypothetical protein